MRMRSAVPPDLRGTGSPVQAGTGTVIGDSPLAGLAAASSDSLITVRTRAASAWSIRFGRHPVGQSQNVSLHGRATGPRSPQIR